MKPTIYWPIIMSIVVLVLLGKGGGLSLDILWIASFLLPVGYLVGLYSERRKVSAPAKPLAVSKRERVLMFLSILIASASIPAAIIHDLYKDRQHTVVLDRPVIMYSERERKEELKLGNISRVDEPIVLRIRTSKDGLAIRVKTNTGKEGWIFAGPGVVLH